MSRHACSAQTRPHPRSTAAFIAAQLLLGLLLVALLLGLRGGSARAQEAVGGYVVQPGDTLSVIAARYGVAVDELTALNRISDPNLLRVGQVLLIPGATGVVPETAVPSGIVAALPGETIAAVARRVGQEPAVVAALNGLGESDRLWPGRPVRVPESAVPAAPMRFGAITAVEIPETLAQGRTGRLVVETSRPIVVEGNWNGTPLPFAPLDVITRQVALVPVPALIGTGTYPLTLTYTTRAGAPVARLFSVEVVDGGYFQQVITVPADRTDLLSPENVVDEEALVAEAWRTFTPDLVLRVPFARPIAAEYATSSPFGTRRFYDSGPNSYNGYHAGQDFSAPPGVAVPAPAPGIVALAEPLTVRGNAVIIDHGRGVFSGYWHLSELRVTPGQVVNTGDVIGLVGNTGLSTGAHLHWELRVYGIAVDPMQFLDEAFFP